MKFSFSADFLASLEKDPDSVKEINPLKCKADDFRSLISFFAIQSINEIQVLKNEVTKLSTENEKLNNSVNAVVAENNSIKEAVDLVVTENLDLRKEVEELKAQNSKRESDVTDLKNRTLELEKAKDQVKKDTSDGRDRILNLERHSRSRNLRFILKEREKEKEDTTQMIYDELAKVGVNIHIEHSHRVGKKDGDRPRQIIACFDQRPDRFKVLKKRSELFTAGVMVFDDLCAHDYNEKKKHKDFMKELHARDRRVKFMRGCWWVDGEKFSGSEEDYE